MDDEAIPVDPELETGASATKRPPDQPQSDQQPDPTRYGRPAIARTAVFRDDVEPEKEGR